MSSKLLALLSLGVFALGFGASISPAHAAPSCDACQNSFDACIASGTTAAVCLQRTRSCFKNCRQ